MPWKMLKYIATLIILENLFAFFTGCWGYYFLLCCYVEPAKLIYMYIRKYMNKKNTNIYTI